MLWSASWALWGPAVTNVESVFTVSHWAVLKVRQWCAHGHARDYGCDHSQLILEKEKPEFIGFQLRWGHPGASTKVLQIDFVFGKYSWGFASFFCQKYWMCGVFKRENMYFCFVFVTAQTC